MRTQISPSNGPALINPVMGILHTAQGARTDESLGNFCANPVNGVSYGYGIDDNSVTLMVPESRQSWSALGANRFAIHICLTGFAEWTRAQWLEHPVMLAQTADLIREISAERGWPIRHSTPEQIRNREGGWAGHGDYSDATGDGDHWDPGPDFPWDIVLADDTPAVPEVPPTVSEEDEIMAVLDEIKFAINEGKWNYPLTAYQEGGGIILRASGVKWVVPDPAYFDLVVFLRFCGGGVVPVGGRANISGFLDTMYMSVMDQSVNGAELTAALDKLVADITPADAAALVQGGGQ